MADKKLFFTVGADVGPGTQAFSKLARDAKKSMGDVDDALDDTESAGKSLARALEAQFESIDASITETKAVADTLATALGPELAGKIDTTAVVQEFRKLGLSLEEIEADADSLAAALKKADDVSLKHFNDTAGTTRRQVDDVSDSARGANSALANMVGNSAQDLGALGGVAGSVGVGIGQMAEYASDATLGGERLTSALGSMAKVAGPMAVLGLAIQGVGTYMDGIEAEKAFRADLVNRFTGEIREAKTQAESLYDTLKETGDLDYSQRLSSGFLSLGSETKSLLPLIEKLGLSWDQVVADIEDPAARDRIRETTKEMVFQGEEGQHLATVWNDYADGIDQYGDSWRQAQAEQEIANRLLDEGRQAGGWFADVLDKVGKSSKKTADATDDLADSHEDAADAAREQRDRAIALTSSLQSLAGSTHDTERAQLALEDAMADLEAQQWDNIGVQNNAKASDAEKAASARNLRDAELNAADAAWALAQRMAEQSGATDGSAAKTRIMRDALQEQANKYPHLRDEIQAYIDQLNRIPTSKTTNVNTIYRSSGQPNAGAGSNRAEAGGGTTYGPNGAWTLVGENGPEIVRKAPGDHTYSNGESRSMLAGGASGAVVFAPSVTINAGAGTDERALQRAVRGALEGIVRDNGPGSLRRLLGLSSVA